jgi:hypothetical protein
LNGTEIVPTTNLGIAWTTDKDVKFGNPPNASFCKYKNIYFKNPIYFFCKLVFTQHPHPPNWNYTAWDLDSTNDNNNGYKNEDFIVWMRTAAMPTFRKLYRKLLSNGTDSFQNGLPRGNYILTVAYSKRFI